MKNYYKFILLAFLVLVAFSVFNASRYISYLKAQNAILANNISPIMKRIAILEADKTMEKITFLRKENAALKNQIANLRAELNRVSRQCAEGKQALPGNKGSLLKK